MAQNENISLSLANKIDVLNKSQSLDARYGVYDDESSALSAMLSYGADGRQVAVYKDKINGKTVVKVYNEVLHQLEPLDPEVYELIAEGVGVTLEDNGDGTFSLKSQDNTILSTINKASLVDNEDGTFTFNNTGYSGDDVIIDFSVTVQKQSEQWASVILTETTATMPQINENNRNINITGNPSGLSSLGGFVASGGASIANFWDGMTAKVLNSTPNNQTIKHNYSEADIKYLFPNEEDYTIRPNEVVYFDLKGGNLVFRYSTFLNAKDVFFDNTESGLEAENVQEAIEILSGMGLQSVSENGNYTDIPLFLKYLNLGESPANYYKVNIGSALFYSTQNQGITNDGTYYYTTENFTITKRLMSDNSIVLVKNNPAGGNRLGGIFYDSIDNVLLVCAGSNNVSSPTANVYRIDPENLEDIEGVSLTTELPGAAINAIFRQNNDIYVGQTLANAPGKRGIYRLNLDLEVENKVYESYKNWQDATVVGGDVYITDHNGSISVFEINQDEFKLKRIYEYNQSFREGLTHIGGINFVAFIESEDLFKEIELTNDLGNPDVKLRLNSEDDDSDILALITNQGLPVAFLTKNGWLSLGTRLNKPLAPLHIKSPISGDAFTAILLENGSNTEGSEVEIKGTLSSASGIRTGKIAHKHFGSLGRGWEFGVTGSSYANKMWLLGNGTLLIADDRELLGDGSAKLQTDGGAFIKGKIFNESTKAEAGELYNVLVDEHGEYKSSPQEVLPKIVSLSVFNQINESSVSGDDGVSLLNPDYGLAILIPEDLQEGNSFSGEFVIHIDNQDKLTVKVLELFGAEIYNNINPSDEVIAKVNYKLDFFNPVGDDIDYKLSWQYVSSGEILFGQHTDTIDSTENILLELLVAGHEDDVFTLKSAYLNRATNIEERLLSTKTFKLGSEVKNAVYSNLILGNNIPKLNTMLAIDEFISSLKTAGIWSKIDIFSLFQMNDNTLADFALYDYKRGTFMTAYGGMIYDEFGYQGNGIDGYIDTEFNPSTDGDNYTLDDASRLFWLSKNPTNAGQSYVDVSSDTPNSGNMNYFRILGGTTRMFINQGTTLLSGGNVDSTGLGFKAINRTSSTDVAVFNGTTKNARTATSSEINNAKQLLFTSGNGYSDMGLGFYAMGASLTDQDVEDIINFYNEYLTEIGL